MTERKPPVSVPVISPTGDMLAATGRRARAGIFAVYEMLGGHEGLHAWAVENPGDFYTKLFPKIVPKEVEVSDTQSLENALEELDRIKRENGENAVLIGHATHVGEKVKARRKKVVDGG